MPVALEPALGIQIMFPAFSLSPHVNTNNNLTMFTEPAASPMMALQRDLPASSPSTSGESPTSPVPPSMETPLGVPPRLMLTTTMSLELVPGDTVMPVAPWKV